MRRAPFQILVFPYRKSKKAIHYALFHRADMDIWQAIAGGGENNETPLKAVKRELYEETQIIRYKFVKLDTMNSISVTNFRDSYQWGNNVYVIPEHCFGVDIDISPIKLSNEHKEYKFCNYAEALSLLHFDSNKTALWELNQKLQNLGPRNEVRKANYK